MTKQQANLIIAGIVAVIGIQVLFAVRVLPMRSSEFANSISERSSAQRVLDEGQRNQAEGRVMYAAQQSRLNEALRRVDTLTKELERARAGEKQTGSATEHVRK